MDITLARISERAKAKPKEPFTSLYHLLNVDLLRICHYEFDGSKAAGVDGITKEEYEKNLEENLNDLASRLARMGYRPQHLRTYMFVSK